MDHNQHHHHQHHHPSSTPAPVVSGHPSHHTHHAEHNHAVYFNFDLDVPVLFTGWLLNSRTGIFALCLGTLILGILYQGIKHLRVYVHRDIPLVKHSALTREHALQTLLYSIQIIIRLASCQKDCSKPISRVNTGLTRLSASDVKITDDQELEPLSDTLDQCENCRETRL
ncbi:unnamed protein product [Mytilus edulis]|uniref:Copper transport protein n=1 Tax=Mytilus edulis TaxID=6550 RepID=A0A8S3QDI7_MYTED|nr:unnamed protein product [Mytilus edulis]